MLTSIVGLRMAFSSLSLICLFAIFNTVSGTDGDFSLYTQRHNHNQKIFPKQDPLPDVKTAWFIQRLNHFDPSDTREWQQRYFINDTFYKPGGPVFLMIEGETQANPVWMKTGQWTNFAEKLGAYFILIEHRFYGKSQPTSDASLANLRYLTSEQALGDLAAFTSAMKLEKFPTNKWVAFGGSYAGALAAWYRLKYPHLVDISVASSAPIKAQLNFKEYFGVVSAVMHRTNPQCSRVVKEAVQKMEDLLKKGPMGWEVIQHTFNLCRHTIGTNQDDVSNLFLTFAYYWQQIVQYNNANREFKGSTTANITVQNPCDMMTQETTDAVAKTPMQRFADVNNLIEKALKQSCTDFQYSNLVHGLQETDWNSSFVKGGTRQFIFQTCTEFGFFQNSDLPDQPFGHDFPIDFVARICQDVFGPKYDSAFIENAIKWTNINYGGKNIKVTRVIFVNGSFDPWHVLGLKSQSETTADNLVVFIYGTAHNADMYPSSVKDPPQLIDARARILQQITNWLKE